MLCTNSLEALASEEAVTHECYVWKERDDEVTMIKTLFKYHHVEVTL